MSRKKQKKAKEKAPEVKRPEEPVAEDIPVNYGGLPQRDLKKNLGCG